ncbi:MAG: permease [Acidimicrobiales bacterium]
MIGATPAFVHWFAVGFKEALAMIWMTWWPLVLGFMLSGLIQSLLPRESLRASLGASSPSSVAKATMLGVISSSCSYAASAVSRALFARGASWSNAVIFMVASTNLVIELGVLLYLLLGWRFVLAQLLGGFVMVVLLALTTRVMFNARRQQRLKVRVLEDAPPEERTTSSTWRQRLDRQHLSSAARYSIGDLTMLRTELLAGFVVAGFLAVHVPTSWWRHLFWSGHGVWTVLENVLLAPLVAVVAFVCSIGNIPLAAALWSNGVAFGGVIAFIFADLITLPLLAIYRRYYGTSSAWRLFVLLWFTMSTAGLVVDGLFHLIRLAPTSHHVRVLDGEFPLGVTLVLNVLATMVLFGAWWLARRGLYDALLAKDPVCGMAVDTTSPAAMSLRNGRPTTSARRPVNGASNTTTTNPTSKPSIRSVRCTWTLAARRARSAPMA